MVYSRDRLVEGTLGPEQTSRSLPLVSLVASRVPNDLAGIQAPSGWDVKRLAPLEIGSAVAMAGRCREGYWERHS